MKEFKKLWIEEDGQGLVEYGLIVGLIAVFCMGAMTLMGGGINSLLGRVNTELGKAAIPAQ